LLPYTLRRLLLGIVTLFLISFVVYGLIRAMPGDPASLALWGQEGAADLTVNAREFEEMRRAYGLDKPWASAYFEWLGKILRGDLGISLYNHRPVNDMILDALGPTLLLSVTSLSLAYLLSIPLGLYSAHRAGKLDERALSACLYVLYSFPSYVVAVFLLLLFSVELKLLPLTGMHGKDHETLSGFSRGVDLLEHMILPVACYTYGSLAYYTRFIRSNLLEVSRQNYILTARAKGLSEWTVLVKHAFRNALIPLVTLIGLSLPTLLSGSVILENIFAWPGMGRLFYQALETRDYPLIMGVTLMFSVLVLAGTLLADLLYALVDPRISYA
jgi:peptide/nickel transport system permease protein